MDKDTQDRIEERIRQLEEEGGRVANMAADHAYAPYLAAIGELRRLLPQPDQPAAPAKKKS